MNPYMGAVALLVADQDETITWYTEKPGFDLIEDIDMGKGKRWMLLAHRVQRDTAVAGQGGR